MKERELKRDVRTLLFGKIAPTPHENKKGQIPKDHDVLYQQIYRMVPEGYDADSTDSAYTFMTFGGYDAIRVYKPNLKNSDGRWLNKVYEDKERIIQMPSDDIIYHQMHLVSQHPDTQKFWAVQSDEAYPFFLATLIYGVNTEKLKEAKKKYAKDHHIENIHEIFFGSSKYEQMIRLHMEQHCEDWGDQVLYAIYNGITVADVVVLWRAKNLRDALKVLTRIEYSGVARKTLTTIGFPIGADGRIKRCVLENLILNMNQTITVSVQGSVRDFEQCMSMQNLFTKILPDSTCKNIRDESLKLSEKLEHISGSFAEELRRLNRELAEKAVEERFTDEVMEKVRALHTETDSRRDSLAPDIVDSVEKILREAEEQSRNTVDKIKARIHELSEKAPYNPDAHSMLRGALHSGRMKRYLDNLNIIANNSKDYDQYKKRLGELLPLIYTELCCGMCEYQWLQSLGKSDFTATARISYANLANLLEIYRRHHRELSDACWEFLTDVKIDQTLTFRKEDDEWIGKSKRPTNVLCRLYSDFQEICAESDDPGRLNLRQFSWFNAFQELLGTHHYIDHHPVLHGPSYLVYTSLKIAYSYFAGLVPNYESVEKRTLLLNRSEENIIDFIRNLDQLTEQISRNDDAMLNNRSNTHTIHFSLPESALEFYHAFLRRIVNFLVQFDRDEGLVPDNFEYDFLLSPKTCGNFRFRPMLRTEHSDHKELAGKVWPQKQAYILELPLESIFNPIDIFIPFVHESFHCFGDVLRQRQLRKKYMSLFIASNLLEIAEMNRPEYRSFSGEIARVICPSNLTEDGSYLTTSWNQLVINTEDLLDKDTLEELTEMFGSRVKEETLLRWLKTRGKILEMDQNSTLFAERMTVSDAILKNCKTYFKECYADAMTMALLQISPEEYLKNSREVLRHSYYKYHQPTIPGEKQKRINSQFTYLAQRFAIVLATCCLIHRKYPEDKLRECTVENCIAAINKIDDPDDAHTDNDVNYGEFSRILKECFSSLIDVNRPMKGENTLHSPATLIYVIKYLIDSIELLYSKNTVLTIPGDADSGEKDQEYTCRDLAEQFDKVIRQNNMFGEEFYEMIQNHHKEVRKAVEESMDSGKS